MQKRLTEIAVARTGAETEFTIAAFSGPVLRKRKNSAANNEGIVHARGPKKIIAPHGSVSSTLQNESRYSARELVRSQICAIQPPVRVPAMPSTTVMAPTVRLALATDRPTLRCRNVGIHAEIPPIAKVSVARPIVAVRRAGLRKIPNAVAR